MGKPFTLVTEKYQRPPAKATGVELVVTKRSSSPELALLLWYSKLVAVGTGNRLRELKTKSSVAPRVRTRNADVSVGKVT